jgi:hypothetical protein
MSIGNWFRRFFSSGSGSAEDEAALDEEYGAAAEQEQAPDFVAGGPTGPGLAGFEAAQAAEDAIHATDPPADPAP